MDATTEEEVKPKPPDERRAKTEQDWAAHYKSIFEKAIKPNATFTDEGQVIIKESVLNDMLEYSSSLPSGTYLYKCWKAKYKSGWWIGQYVPDPEGDPKMVGIKWWKVVSVY